jgi:hypothetical protein
MGRSSRTFCIFNRKQANPATCGGTVAFVFGHLHQREGEGEALHPLEINSSKIKGAGD